MFDAVATPARRALRALWLLTRLRAGLLVGMRAGLLTGLLTVMLGATVAATARAAPAVGAAPVVTFGPGPWVAPVSGPVVRGFRAPACAYCPGHRGADFRAPAGTVVRTVGTGTVVWAGRIAGAGHVVVAHGEGLRTSLSFLRTVTVRIGQRLGVGAPVGSSGATGAGHDASVVHLGLRVGERYVDPMLLFRAPDLARAVRLVDSSGDAR